jgi:DNA-binding CsgD family transcriptional regulator
MNLQRVARACERDATDFPSLRTAVLRELQRVVPFDAAFMAAADPETLLFTSAIADEPLRPSGPLFLDNEFGDARDFNRFASLARSSDPVSSLDSATRGQPGDSERWREIIAPLGMGDEARAALRLDGITWGYLCLHRTNGGVFTPRELADLRRAGPWIAHAIRRLTADHAAPREPVGGTALVMVEEDRITAIGGAVEYWAEQLGWTGAEPGRPLPLPFLALTRRLQAREAVETDALPTTVRMVTREKSLVNVTATRLRDERGAGPVMVSLTGISAEERSSLMLAARGLTPAQLRVAQLVLQGRTTRQIVLELRISEYTVQDHLKAVFDKMGIRSRRELAAVMMTPPAQQPRD